MHRKVPVLICLAVLANLPLASDLKGQTDRPIAIQRCNGPVHLDGTSDEPAWRGVEPFHPVMFEPNFGGPPSERTETLVCYDHQYIYFALRAYDSEPDEIRGNILYRDRFGGDDYFEVMLDTYNDNEHGVIFTTSPTGFRRDTEVSRDASGPIGGWLNVDYNTFWDAAAATNDDGWFAEIRVPFSSLRFRDDDGRVVMGMVLHRIIARKSERVTFPAILPNANFAFLKPSRAQKIVLEGVYSRSPLYVTPYGLTGFERAPQWSAAHGAFLPDNVRKGEVGGDLKYGLTNQLTMDLTVNTDFAQVEADDQQINLTRFSLFFPEKRQFFQERAGMFEFTTGGNSRLFHSRRIGLADDGRPVRILGGARLVGRIGQWDLGFLDMQTAESETLPAENFGVLRVRRQAFNPYSFAGGMITSRFGMDGSSNLAYGLDGVFRVAGDDYFSFQWAQTSDDSPPSQGTAQTFDSGRFSTLLERRRRDGFGYATHFVWSGSRYDPGVGFVQRRDFTQLDQTLSHSWLPGERSPFIWHTAGVQGVAYLRNSDRSVETAELGPNWSFADKAGNSGQIYVSVVYDDLRHPFFLAREVEIPANTYSFYRAGASYTMSRNRDLRTGAQLSTGSFYDGWQTSVSLSPNWYVSPHLELSGTYIYNRIRFPDREAQFDGHIARLRIGTALNTQISTNAFVQFNSAASALSANIRFRYNFREGNDFWIVYDEGIDTWSSRPVDPTLVPSDNRTILVKYTYTFQL